MTKRLLLAALLFVSAPALAQFRIADATGVKPMQHKLKLIGSGLTVACVDNSGNFRTDCTFTATGSYAATVGTWVQSILSQDSTNANFLRYTPNDSGTLPWYQWAGSFANSPGPRRNQVMRFGWNIGPGGGRQNPGALNGSLASEYEQYYEASIKVMERHEAFVAPDETLTRWLSFSGNLEAPYNTAWYGYATEISLGTGHTASDPASLAITATATNLKSPGGYRKVLLNDGDNSLTISNGNSGNADRAHLLIDSTGGLTYNATSFFRHYFNGGELRIEADSSHTDMRSPDNSSRVYADDNFVLISQGSTPAMYFQTSRMQSGRHIYPLTDSDKTLGGPSQRWSVAMVGAPVAAQPTCDSTTRGAKMTVFATSSNSDTEQVCMKAAADTYAWRTIYTAP